MSDSGSKIGINRGMSIHNEKITPHNEGFYSESVAVNIQKFSISIVNTKDASKNKEILHPISTVVEGGTLFAILGGSGSGKTTLLNVIAGRYSAKQLAVGGEIRFGALKKCTIGYVTQQDFLLPNLTVRETLLFAARMKVDPNTRIPAGERFRKETTDASTQQDIYSYLADEVIQDLGLKECANSMVGDNSGNSQLAGGNRGLSGGERRRVSIAIQIISDCKGESLINSTTIAPFLHYSSDHLFLLR
jgi:ABC-type multidrug transport system ATPase subunit